ncbi:MAG TPA: sodium:solute symporter family protein [Vicinamibacterales bacterium]|nr:sodium:solute symporter family protein [Vicinamibacterales bacterium]
MLIGLAGYVTAMLAIGAWVSRRIHSDTDYLVAGRSLGPVLVAFSVFATWFGAETIIGASGSIYTDGLAGGNADPFGYGLCLILAGVVFAVPLWKRGLTTYADLFRQRYSPGVERLMVLLYVPSSVIWGAAQIRAFGQVLGVASGLELDAAIAASAVIVITYTLLGGLLADAITDVVQGLALVVGLVVIFLAVTAEAGGLAAGLALVEPDRFQPFGAGGRSPLEVLEEWAVPVLGSLLAAEILQRIIGARSAAAARNGTLGGAALYIGFGLIPVYLGLVGPTLLPGLADPEELVPTLASRYLGPVTYILFSGALVSIILSTVDSTLLAAGGLLSHNLILPLRPALGPRARLRWTRGTVLILGLVATWMALGANTMYDLVLTASAFGSAGVVVVSCFALFTRVGGPASAHGALVTGLVVWAYGDFVGEWTAPFLAAIVASIAAYLAPVAVERLRPPR